MLMSMLVVPVRAEPPAHDQLSRQAVSFLELLDQGRYDEAWQTTAVIFKNLTNQSQWQGQLQTVRAAYDPLSSRQLHRISYRHSYNLSPDGRYVIVQFKSSYTNKANTTETVVLDCRTTPECSIREYIIN